MRHTSLQKPVFLASVFTCAVFLSFSLFADQRTYELTLGGLTFDPLTDFPVLDSAGAHESHAGPNFRLIQFDGPIQGDWLRDVRGHGIKVVQYIHPYTYIVWADQAQLAAARSASGVRWTGEFAAEFRVLPDQLGRDSSMVPTMALVSNHADQRAVRAQLEQAGAVVHGFKRVTVHTSVVHLDVPGNHYMDLARVPAVYTVQYIEQDAGPRSELSNQAIVVPFATNQDVVPGYASWLSATGYDGDDVVVGIVDGGIRTTHQDLVGRIAPCVPSGDSPSSCTTANDSHGTHVAAAVAGTGASGITDAGGFLRGQGVAPGASVVQQRYSSFLGGGPGGMVPDGMLKIFRESALSGASHANNSWGPSGTPQGYNIPTQQIDIITRDALPEVAGNQGVLPVWSIMNGSGDSGGACAPSSLGSPDEAKNLFGVGSTQLIPGSYPGGTIPNPATLHNISYNSAHGPTCDGRTGLHIVAPGCGTDSASSGSDTAFGISCGTSMASPVVSGAAAVFIERYRDIEGADPSPAMIKAALTAVAVNLHGYQNADGGTITQTPSRFQGYGRLDLDAVANPPYNVMFFDQEEVFTSSSDAWTLPLIADDPAEPVRLMLMWTDAHGHGLGGTTPAWVNDLDLTVEAGTGIYLGNVIGTDGFSETGGTADDRNNAEAVFLRADQHDGNVFNVTVSVANLAADALNPHDPQDPSQDFALVCYNCDFGDPTFSLSLEPQEAAVCIPESGTEETTIDVAVGGIGTYTGTVTLASAGEPAGVSSALDPTTVVVPDSSEWTLTVADSAAPGNAMITLTGDDGSDTHQVELQFTLDDALGSPALLAPADAAADLPLQPEFIWDALPGAVEYRILVATDEDLTAIVIDELTTDPVFTPAAPLDTGTEYFWMVQGLNSCGGGIYSVVFSFTTQMEPLAEVTPEALSFEVPQGGVDSDLIEITNTGTGNLVWSIVSDQALGLTAGQREFDGYFEIDNWELVNTPAGVAGSFNTNPGPPIELFVVGGDASSGGNTDFQIEIPTDGTITFDWGYQPTDTGCWDSGGYAVNGVYTELACNDAPVPFFNETATVAVSAGDLFAFRVFTEDGVFGAGTFGVTNFEFVADSCDDPVAVPWLDVDPDNGSTSAGQTDEVTVTVDADGLAEGHYEAYLCITTNAQGHELIALPVELTVTEVVSGQLSVAPAALDFGDVEVGQSVTDSFTVSNSAPSGALDIELSTLEVTAGDGVFEITGGDCAVSDVLSPGDECTVEASFTPDVAGALTGEISVTAVGGQSATVDLAGTGLQDPGVLQIDPSTHDFGDVEVGSTETVELTVTNSAEEGSAPVTITAIHLLVDVEFEDTGAGSCEAGVTVLDVDESCTIEVAFTPSAVGPFTSPVVVYGGGGKSAASALSGSGVEPLPPPEDIFMDRFEAGDEE